MPTLDEVFCTTAVPFFPSKSSFVALMQTKLILPSDEVSLNAEADAEKDESTSESISHF